jgi:hypothetical protein
LRSNGFFQPRVILQVRSLTILLDIRCRTTCVCVCNIFHVLFKVFNNSYTGVYSDKVGNAEEFSIVDTALVVS